MEIKLEKINEHAKLPEFHSANAAGADLYSVESYVLIPGETYAVPLGFKAEVPVGYEMQIRPRSGLALNNHIGIMNTPGTVDADYRGEIKVILRNFGKEDFKINQGDRVAQAVINEIPKVKYSWVGKVNDTERGEGGFGHTGK